MNKKRIAIICLTQIKKGYGNFSRCLNVAESLRKDHHTISFIIDHNLSVINELKKRKFKYVTKPKAVTAPKFRFISDYVHRNQFNVIIIDMREYGECVSKLIVKQGYKTILFDDAWCKNVYVDMLFNGTNSKSHYDYKKINKTTKLFLGTKYWIINDRFQYYKKRVSQIHKKKKYHVVVSMGGADPNNLTSHVVRALLNIQNIHTTVIVGPLFNHLIELKNILNNNKKFKLIYSTSKMWGELSKADIAVANGGNTLFELITLGVPTLCIPAFKHETQFANKFMRKGAIINLGFKQKNLKMISNTLTNTLANTKLRKKMCTSGNRIMDGKGLSRVTNIISNFLQ